MEVKYEENKWEWLENSSGFGHSPDKLTLSPGLPEAFGLRVMCMFSPEAGQSLFLTHFSNLYMYSLFLHYIPKFFKGQKL